MTTDTVGFNLSHLFLAQLAEFAERLTFQGSEKAEDYVILEVDSHLGYTK